MTTVPAVKPNTSLANKTTNSLLEQVKGQLQDSETQKAIAENFTPNQRKLFTNNALALISESTAIQNCTPESIVQAVLTSAQWGLPLNKDMGLAYIVPFKNTATFMPSYRGLIMLAKKNGFIKDVEVMPIYESDIALDESQLFKILFSTMKLRPQQGNVVGFLAGARDKNGEILAEYMTVAEIEKIKVNYSQAHSSDSSPWKKDYVGMSAKTVLKRLMRRRVLAHAFLNDITIDLPDEGENDYDNIKPAIVVEQDTSFAEKVGTMIDLRNDNDRFEKMLQSIKDGNYTFKQALEGVQMTKEQLEKLDDLKLEMGAV